MKFFCKTLCLLLLVATASINAANDNEKGWTLSCNNYQTDYTGAPVANGTIGILPWQEPFSVRHLILNHVFELNDKSGVNCTVRGINPFNIIMTVDGQKIDAKNMADWNQQINMREATHNTTFTADGKVKVSYSIAALRHMPYAAIFNIKLKALKNTEIEFSNAMTVPQEEYQTPRHLHKSYDAGAIRVNILQTNALTKHGRYDVSASTLFIFDKGSFQYSCTDKENAHASIKLTAGQEAELSLVTSECTTHDFSDPYSESEREVIYVAHQTVKSVMAAHRQWWDELWQGDIEIEGDDDSSRCQGAPSRRRRRASRAPYRRGPSPPSSTARTDPRQ